MDEIVAEPPIHRFDSVMIIRDKIELMMIQGGYVIL